MFCYMNVHILNNNAFLKSFKQDEIVSIREERGSKSYKMGFAVYTCWSGISKVLYACWNKCANLNMREEEEGLLRVYVRRAGKVHTR